MNKFLIYLKENSLHLIVVVGFLVGFTSYFFWREILETYGVAIFYKGIALEFTLLYLVIMKLSTGTWKVLFEVFLSIVFSKLIDELFLDPTKFELTELWIVLIGIKLTIVYRWKIIRKKLRGK